MSTLKETALEWFIYYANHIHGYLSLTVCIIGTIGNVFNVIVFTRKRMISPINIILTSLAIVDLVLLLAQCYTVWYFYLEPSDNPYVYWYDSYQIARIMMWQHHMTSILINTSVWLTVLALIWKCKAITNPLRNRIWYNTKTVCKSISLVFILCVLLYLPAIIVEEVYTEVRSGTNLTYYKPIANLSLPLSDIWYIVDYFIYMIILRLISTILIAVYSTKLIYAFSKMKKDRKKLSADVNTNRIQLKSQKSMARTTLTLIILSVLCFVTQLPQYLCALIYCVNQASFSYNFTNEIQTIMVLINSAFTFFIYYITSIQFRENFNALFSIKIPTSNK